MLPLNWLQWRVPKSIDCKYLPLNWLLWCFQGIQVAGVWGPVCVCVYVCVCECAFSKEYRSQVPGDPGGKHSTQLGVRTPYGWSSTMACAYRRLQVAYGPHLALLHKKACCDGKSHSNACRCMIQQCMQG
jgi:hypothetical protein